jgi:hypothetical protein
LPALRPPLNRHATQAFDPIDLRDDDEVLAMMMVRNLDTNQSATLAELDSVSPKSKASTQRRTSGGFS